METYPRKIVLEDAKLVKLLKEKEEMILNGRVVSEDIDAIEAEMDAIDKEVQAVEATLVADDLKERAAAITDEFNAVMAKMDELKKEHRERLGAIVPAELKEKYDAKKKEKDELEIKRNKIALKAQKWNDKIIPIARRLMSKHIGDTFEDYDTIRIENGEVVATLFSHLEDFKKGYLERKSAMRH